MALALILILLPLCCIASAFLAHWDDGVATTVLYFCSTLWLGVGLTLLTAFGAVWAAWGLAAVAGLRPDRLWFGLTALILTGLYCAYGIWNAYHPRLVDLTVRIKNLPPRWKGKTLVQLSDLHLGRILGAKFLARVVAKTNAQKPSMVLITGDLFDGADGNLEKLVAPLNDVNAPREPIL